MRLTDLAIQKLAPPASGQQTYFDDAVRGFGVRVSQGGSKSFIVIHGATRQRKTIGRYPAMTLKDARREAQAFLLSDKPVPNKITVEEALKEFLAHSSARNRPRTTSGYTRLLNLHLPTGKLSDVTRAGLLTKFNRLAATPAEQAHAVTVTKVFLNWCVSAGHLEANPLASVRNVGKIKGRERVLTTEELRTVTRHALQYPNMFGPLVALCILTGQRRGEVAEFRRSFINEDMITLPASLTKNGREHSFPIGPLAQQVIATIPDTGDRLFPGRDDDGPFRGWASAKTRFDPLTTQWQLHDLRRTYATVHAEIGTPIHVIEKLLNHVSGTLSGIAGIYNRYSYQKEMREAVIRYEEHIRVTVAE